MRLRSVGVLLLVVSLACGGEGAPTEPTEGPPAPPSGPEASSAPALSAIEGVWFRLELREGVWSSRDWCEADRPQVQINADELILAYGQDADVQKIVGHTTDGAVLKLEGKHDYEDASKIHHFQWENEPNGRLRLLLNGDSEPWVLARRADLSGAAFLVACCAGPEGEIPEEYALVPEGTDCPPAP